MPQLRLHLALYDQPDRRVLAGRRRLIEKACALQRPCAAVLASRRGQGLLVVGVIHLDVDECVTDLAVLLHLALHGVVLCVGLLRVEARSSHAQRVLEDLTIRDDPPWLLLRAVEILVRLAAVLRAHFRQAATPTLVALLA